MNKLAYSAPSILHSQVVTPATFRAAMREDGMPEHLIEAAVTVFFPLTFDKLVAWATLAIAEGCTLA